MPMSYGARLNAAIQPSEYTDQVTVALASHARWVSEVGSQSARSKQLAARVAHAPLDFTQAMALMVLVLPRNDALETTDELTDAVVLECVGEAWPAFVEPVSE